MNAFYKPVLITFCYKEVAFGLGSLPFMDTPWRWHDVTMKHLFIVYHVRIHVDFHSR
jgi:hypothetical protein